ncbi:MAG: MFS transporter [Ignavibacteriae bacterium]|nr:MFS transporter [Ignavibacteriota bacterium]
MSIPKEEKRNFFAFIWHAFWLALANTFAERNTVLPGLILFVGGSQIEVGILTAITVGVPIFSQLAFAAYLSQKKRKKSYLLLGIYLRVGAFLGTVWTLTKADSISPSLVISLVFFWMLIFSVSGAFAGVSYADILGKSITGNTRKRFFVIRQLLSSIGILISALIARGFLKGSEYPTNYIIMFSAASAMLFIASFGFSAIKEKPTIKFRKERNLFQILRSIPKVLREDKRFKNFIYLINLIQLPLTLIPFIVVLSKDSFELTEVTIGNFLFFQITGMIISNLLWSKVVKRYSFKGVVKVLIGLEIVIPLLSLVAAYFGNLNLFYIIFLFVGFAMSAFKISNEGIFLEITDETNRAMYQGISGSLNITVAFFPLISGLLISSIGVYPIFIGASVLVTFAYLLPPKIKCVEH